MTFYNFIGKGMYTFTIAKCSWKYDCNIPFSSENQMLRFIHALTGLYKDYSISIEPANENEHHYTNYIYRILNQGVQFERKVFTPLHTLSDNVKVSSLKGDIKTEADRQHIVLCSSNLTDLDYVAKHCFECTVSKEMGGYWLRGDLNSDVKIVNNQVCKVSTQQEWR